MLMGPSLPQWMGVPEKLKKLQKTPAKEHDSKDFNDRNMDLVELVRTEHRPLPYQFRPKEPNWGAPVFGIADKAHCLACGSG
jgi:hypothetical protein